MRAPSADLDGICADCHYEVTETYKTSLHSTVRGFETSLLKFGGEDALDSPHEGLGQVYNMNCMACHATCGECHVSRPTTWAGGLINQHEFFSTPPMEQTCFGCHGARNAGEYMGTVGFARDVHYEMGMTCMDCHDVTNFHGTGVAYDTMWEKPVLPSCLDCHEDQTPGQSDLHVHNVHGTDLSCHVCHSQASQSCFECHVSIADDGQSVSSSSEMRILFRIGLNPEITEERPYRYVTLRHIPTAADSYIEFGENLLPNFDQYPNWKYSPTHNIQRCTFQNESCNSCHGNERIFLRESDLRKTDSKANWDLIPEVPFTLEY